MLDAFSALLRSQTLRGLTRDMLLAMDPEIAHQATIAALRLGAAPTPESPDAPELATSVAGLDLGNPVGIAAGFDKNAEVPNALSKLGFGMVEIGTLTPQPQTGNDKPRLYRLPEAQGVINRMGFNNIGHDRALERLADLRCRATIGINIGANKGSPNLVADYVLGVKRFAPYANYLTVNISSPNTPGLRDMQTGEALKRLLGEVLAERSRAAIRVPIFLKIAPDLEEKAMDEIARVIATTDLDGLIVSNSTLSREGVAGYEHATERGGLSGKPLFNLSTRRLAQMRQRLGNAFPLIGVGGIHSAQSAIAKFDAGANAVQLYSALVFSGLDLLDELKLGLVSEVRRQKLTTVAGLTNRAVTDWAEGRASL